MAKSKRKVTRAIVDEAQEYTSRRKLEDAITAFAQGYAAFCMRLYHRDRIDKLEDAMYEALSAHEATLKEINNDR